MENGEWRMENGEWRIGNGKWRIGSSRFTLVGERPLPNHARKETATAICRGRPKWNGELRMENGELGAVLSHWLGSDLCRIMR